MIIIFKLVLILFEILFQACCSKNYVKMLNITLVFDPGLDEELKLKIPKSAKIGCPAGEPEPEIATSAPEGPDPEAIGDPTVLKIS